MRMRPHMLASLFVLTLNAWPQSELPRLNTADFLPAIRAQIDQAEEAASAHPRDPQSRGSPGHDPSRVSAVRCRGTGLRARAPSGAAEFRLALSAGRRAKGARRI